MSVDLATVKRVARLARLAVTPAEVEQLKVSLNEILGFVEQLNEVNVDGVQPMTSVQPMRMKMRADVVDDGGMPGAVVANAAEHEDGFFLVPKVVE